MADADPPRSAPPVPRAVPPAPLVAIAAWLLPGAGYWLIGQRARGTTIGVCILGLFVIGLLVGGVRVIEVPGYVNETGERHMIDVPGSAVRAWALQAAPLGELRDKPWSLPQAMTGPVAVAAGAWSVAAAEPDPANGGRPSGALTHARINEIGSLYLSVAGLLNLMAIIDAAHRAVHLSERRRARLADAAQGAA
jgi:hypothetical protein